VSTQGDSSLNVKEKKIYCQTMQCVSFITALQLSWNVPVDAGFLCNKAAVLSAVIKERPRIMQRNSEYF
jgi:hypothetical protein